MKYACNTCRVNTLFVQSNLKCVVQTSKMCGRPFFFFFFFNTHFQSGTFNTGVFKVFQHPQINLQGSKEGLGEFLKKKMFFQDQKKKPV